MFLGKNVMQKSHGSKDEERAGTRTGVLRNVKTNKVKPKLGNV